jgi:hypothetical protein
MDTLILKLVLTPTLIALASLAGRRWGPAFSGWLIGLPFTSGPVAFFLALSHGVTFAAAVALGTLTGMLAECVFCLTYAWLARRAGWPLTLGISSLSFLLSIAALQYLVLPLALLLPLILVALALAFRLMPRANAAPKSDLPLQAPAPAPRWDLPARMVLATAFVLLLTSVASILGPRLSGLLTPYPLYASILAAFAHRLQGPAAAAGVLRGLLMGLYAFVSFFLALALLIEPAGIALAFLVAILAALTVQACSLLVLRHTTAPVAPAQSEA